MNLDAWIFQLRWNIRIRLWSKEFLFKSRSAYILLSFYIYFQWTIGIPEHPLKFKPYQHLNKQKQKRCVFSSFPFSCFSLWIRVIIIPIRRMIYFPPKFRAKCRECSCINQDDPSSRMRSISSRLPATSCCEFRGVSGGCETSRWMSFPGDIWPWKCHESHHSMSHWGILNICSDRQWGK